MKILFRGTRGTMPVPGKNTVRYGGNTSCVMVTACGKTIFLDAGTGLSSYQGEKSEAGEKAEKEIHLFLSHLHYDHLQGFPFFKPLFHKEKRIFLYAQKPDQMPDLEYAFEQLMRPPYLPFGFRSLPAEIVVRQIEEGEEIVLTDSLRVEAMNLIHPNSCLCYKITERKSDGSSSVLVYSTDTADLVGDYRSRYLSFISGASMLIVDAFFTEDEMYGTYDGISKLGWGHMTWEQGVVLAREAKVQRLALFHHLDSRTDDEMDVIEQEAKKRFPAAFCAAEGQEIEL